MKNKIPNVIARYGCGLTLMLVLWASSVMAQSGLERQIDSLFVIASSSSVRYQEMRDPAMDAIAAFGAPAAGPLIDKFTTRSARKRWTIIWIFQRIGAAAVPDLVAALSRPEDMVVRRVCWALGDIRDSSAVGPLLGVVDHQSWWVRDQALGALGKIGDRAARQQVMEALQDEVGQVRKSAVVACGQMKLEESVRMLIHALGDEFYGVRLPALDALQQLNTAAVIVAAADSLDSPNRLIGHLGCRLLGEIGTDEALAQLVPQLRSDDPVRRAHAGAALAKADPLDNCQFRREYFADEPDRFVRLKIESMVSSLSHETD